jgi:hypothetical protein
VELLIQQVPLEGQLVALEVLVVEVKVEIMAQELEVLEIHLL